VKMGAHPQRTRRADDEGNRRGGVDAVLALTDGLKKFVSIQGESVHGLNF